MKAPLINIKRLLLLALLFASCAAPNAWHLDAIATGNAEFDSSRLRYRSASHLELELLRLGDEILAFVLIKQHRFAPSPLDPSGVDVALVVDGQKMQELAPSREGRMRLKLSKPMTEELIKALQEEKQVAILLDGFEEKISPASFGERYKELTQERWDLMNWIKGPFG